MFACDVEVIINKINEIIEYYILDFYDDETKEKLEKQVTEELNPAFNGILVETNSEDGSSINFKITYNEGVLNLKYSTRKVSF